MTITQWPDNYDFESTRAINRPAPASLEVDEKQDDESDRKDSKENDVTVKGSVAGDSFDRTEEDDELDPVSLNKAFNFAAWSSLTLVCSIGFRHLPNSES